MQHYKKSKLLNNSSLSESETEKWIKVNKKNTVNKNIRFKTSMSRSDLCDYSEACIVVKEITAEGSNDAKKELN